MTPKLYSLKGHTWAEIIEESGGHRVKLIVYESAVFYSPDRYFLEYRGGEGRAMTIELAFGLLGTIGSLIVLALHSTVQRS